MKLRQKIRKGPALELRADGSTVLRKMYQTSGKILPQVLKAVTRWKVTAGAMASSNQERQLIKKGHHLTHQAISGLLLPFPLFFPLLPHFFSFFSKGERKNSLLGHYLQSKKTPSTDELPCQVCSGTLTPTTVPGTGNEGQSSVPLELLLQLHGQPDTAS